MTNTSSEEEGGRGDCGAAVNAATAEDASADDVRTENDDRKPRAVPSSSEWNRLVLRQEQERRNRTNRQRRRQRQEQQLQQQQQQEEEQEQTIKDENNPSSSSSSSCAEPATKNEEKSSSLLLLRHSRKRSRNSNTSSTSSRLARGGAENSSHSNNEPRGGVVPVPPVAAAAAASSSREKAGIASSPMADDDENGRPDYDRWEDNSALGVVQEQQYDDRPGRHRRRERPQEEEQQQPERPLVAAAASAPSSASATITITRATTITCTTTTTTRIVQQQQQQSRHNKEEGQPERQPPPDSMTKRTLASDNEEQPEVEDRKISSKENKKEHHPEGVQHGAAAAAAAAATAMQVNKEDDSDSEDVVVVGEVPGSTLPPDKDPRTMDAEELRTRARRYVTEAIESIPLVRKQAYTEAMMRAPQVVATETDPMQFVRFCQYHIQASADRLVLYWEERLKLFGRDRAFLPMIQTGQGALTTNDTLQLKAGFPALLPKTSTGLQVMLCDRRQYLRSSAASLLPSASTATTHQTHATSSSTTATTAAVGGYSSQNVISERTTQTALRCCFYLMQILAQDDVAQMEGIVLLFILVMPRLEPYDRTFCISFFSMAKQIFPIKLQVHVLNRIPRKTIKRFPVQDILSSFVTELLDMGYGPEDTVIHIERGGENNDDGLILEELMELGLSNDGIPSSFGGEWSFQHFLNWCTHRVTVEQKHQNCRTNQKNKNNNDQEDEKGTTGNAGEGATTANERGMLLGDSNHIQRRRNAGTNRESTSTNDTTKITGRGVANPAAAVGVESGTASGGPGVAYHLYHHPLSSSSFLPVAAAQSHAYHLVPQQQFINLNHPATRTTYDNQTHFAPTVTAAGIIRGHHDGVGTSHLFVQGAGEQPSTATALYLAGGTSSSPPPPPVVGAAVADDNNAPAAKTTNVHLLSEQERISHRRMINAIHSRRKRDRRRVEFVELQKECKELKEENARLLTHHQQLTALLEQAQAIVRNSNNIDDENRTSRTNENNTAAATTHQDPQRDHTVEPNKSRNSRKHHLKPT